MIMLVEPDPRPRRNSRVGGVCRLKSDPPRCCTYAADSVEFRDVLGGPASRGLNWAPSPRVGRLRKSRSYVSSPACRWRAVAALERTAECRLRHIADVRRDERDWTGGVAEQVGGGVEAYLREISGWRHSDPSDEPSSERPLRASAGQRFGGRFLGWWR